MSIEGNQEQVSPQGDSDGMPSVSAIIITHNRKDLVLRAINSVQAQTYSRIELVVVDDASEDGSKEVLEELSHANGFSYIYIQAEDSRGGNYARNMGIRYSKGELIAFLDDDDEWMPEKIEKQVDYLIANSDYGAVSCYRIIERDRKEYRKQRIVPFAEGEIGDAIFTRIPYITSTVMIRRSVLDKCGLFDEGLLFWQEYELSIRFTNITKVGYVHEYLCLYRMIASDPERLTNKLDGWEQAIAYIREKHRKRIKALPADIRRQFERLIAGEGMYRAERAGNREKTEYYFRLALANELKEKKRIYLRIWFWFVSRDGVVWCKLRQKLFR